MNLLDNVSNIDQRASKLSDERWALVVSNIGLVDTMISFCKSKFPIVKEDMDDFYDVGAWSLIHAARKYDFERKEAKFSTYALTTIRNDMMRAINLRIKMKKKVKSSEDFNKDRNESFSDLFVSKNNVLNDIVSKEEIEDLYQVIKDCPDKYKKVIHLRFFKDKTFQEIGIEFGVTREMARIYYHEAIDYIKQQIA